MLVDVVSELADRGLRARPPRRPTTPARRPSTSSRPASTSASRSSGSPRTWAASPPSAPPSPASWSPRRWPRATWAWPSPPSRPAAVSTALSLWGTDEQQQTYLPAFTGDDVPAAALALAEPTALFDPLAPATKAERSGDGFVLTGTKSGVPRGHDAELFIVGAELDGKPQLFIVESSTSGLTVETDPSMGVRAAGLSQARPQRRPGRLHQPARRRRDLPRRRPPRRASPGAPSRSAPARPCSTT